MTDEQFPELVLRASAYLDGVLDDRERTEAEADQAVMAEVEQLRALRDELRSVDPPLAAVRESAISAALAEFDRLHATSAAPADHHRQQVVAFRRRPVMQRWLAVAAAVVGLGVVGVVVSRAIQTSGDSDSAAGQFASATTLDSAATRSAMGENDAESGDAAATQAPMAAEAGVATTAASAGGASSDVAMAAPATTAAAAQITSAAPIAPFDDAAPITGPDALAAAGRSLLAYPPATTPESRCVPPTGADLLADAQYTTPDGAIVAVVVAVDPLTTRTYAIDRESCDLVATAGG